MAASVGLPLAHEVGRHGTMDGLGQASLLSPSIASVDRLEGAVSWAVSPSVAIRVGQSPTTGVKADGRFFGPPHGPCARSPALVGRRHRPIHAHVASHQTPRRRHPSTGMDGRAMGGGCLGRRLVWGVVWHRQVERRPRHRVPGPCGTALPHSVWGLPPQRVHPRVHGQRLGRRTTRMPNPASQRAMVQGLQPSAVGRIQSVGIVRWRFVANKGGVLVGRVFHEQLRQVCSGWQRSPPCGLGPTRTRPNPTRTATCTNRWGIQREAISSKAEFGRG